MPLRTPHPGISRRSRGQVSRTGKSSRSIESKTQNGADRRAAKIGDAYVDAAAPALPGQSRQAARPRVRWTGNRGPTEDSADGETRGLEPARVRASERRRIAAKPTRAPNEDHGHDFYLRVARHIHDAVRRNDLTRSEKVGITKPERQIEVHFPLVQDDGRRVMLTGFRVVHSTLAGAGKGGIRVAPDVTRKTVRALAAEMAAKVGLYGLPLGGAKGGIIADPRSLSPGECARMMRGYVGSIMDRVWIDSGHRELAFGPWSDVPAPDVGTSHPSINLMDVCADEYLRWIVHRGIRRIDEHRVPDDLFAIQPDGNGPETPYLDRYVALFRARKIPNLALIASFTGKSVAKGGSAGRSGATGLGVAWATLETMRRAGDLPPGAERFERGGGRPVTVAVQGFGNVGSSAVKSYLRFGALVRGILERDREGPFLLYRNEGFDAATLEALEHHVRDHGTLRGFPDARMLNADRFWTLDVDVLAPCAKENVVTGKNAKRIKARYLAEGANGPTEDDADKTLTKRKVRIIPDIFANAAGVLVSFFEMEQNLKGEVWTEAEVEAKLRRTMSAVFEGWAAQLERRKVTARDAAYDLWAIHAKEALASSRSRRAPSILVDAS